MEPLPWVLAEVRVLGDAGGDRWMCDLEQERTGSGSEQEHRLTIEAPGDRVRTEQARVAVRGGQRSSGRRLTSHQAAGNAAPAMAALARSQTRNWVIPELTAVDHGMSAVTFSQGTPKA